MADFEKVLIATGNQGKLREFQALLGEDFPYQLICLKDLNLSVKAPEETGRTYLDNARIKARYYAEYVRFPILADDSGLECLDLDGYPGVQSARIDDTDASRRSTLIKKLKEKAPDKDSYPARFVCSLVFLAGGLETDFTGICEGFVKEEERGENGFGYDPIFHLPEGKTLAECSMDMKNSISHRARAVQEFLSHTLKG